MFYNEWVYLQRPNYIGIAVCICKLAVIATYGPTAAVKQAQD